MSIIMFILEMIVEGFAPTKGTGKSAEKEKRREKIKIDSSRDFQYSIIRERIEDKFGTNMFEIFCFDVEMSKSSQKIYLAFFFGIFVFLMSILSKREFITKVIWFTLLLCVLIAALVHTLYTQKIIILKDNQLYFIRRINLKYEKLDKIVFKHRCCEIIFTDESKKNITLSRYSLDKFNDMTYGEFKKQIMASRNNNYDNSFFENKTK